MNNAMTQTSFRYHAFISYRHASPDREWAAWLHSAIESYRVPGKLVRDKGLPRRVRPLFRDQEELSASSDLTDSIVKALQESRTLIVVCSPSTPISHWVNEEVRRFRHMRPGGRVLALLVAGEPSQSFPPALLEPRAETPGEQAGEKVEPLAADVRPHARASSRRIKRTAKLKLIAAILDCGYDELLRREAQRRSRNYTIYAFVLAVVLVLTGVLGFRWRRERRTAFSRELASAALEHLETDPDLAALLSLKAVGVEPTGQAEDAIRQSALRLSDRLAVLKGHTGGVYQAAFSPDGLSVLTAGEDGTARIWEPTTGRSLAELRGHAGPVVYAEFSRDGRRVITSSKDGTARVWDAGTGKALAELRGHAGPLLNAVFSPDGRRVATVSFDQTARIWDVNTGHSLFELQHHTGQDTHLKPKDTNVVYSVAFSPDGRLLLTGSADGRARIWAASTGERLSELVGRDIIAREAAFSPDGKLVVASSSNGARIWDAGTGKQLADLIGHTGLINTAAFSPSGKLVVTASYDGTARVWDATTGTAQVVLRGHGSWVVAAAFSLDERLIVTASADATARVWLLSGRRMDTLRGHTDYVRAAAFSPDSRFIATAGYDRTARIWEIGATRAPLVLRGHAGRIASVAYDPSGRLLITASEDHTAKVYDANTGETRADLRGHSGRVSGALFSPDGRFALTYGDDGAARVWDVNSGRVMSELSHPASVTRAAYSRDGQYVLTTGADGKARVWDIGARRAVEIYRRVTRKA